MQRVLTIISIVSLVLCVVCCFYLVILKRKRRLDYSAWMVCDKCVTKWRPTAYGPPTPDDYYCPVCKETTYAHFAMDPHRKIAQFTEGLKIPK